jgi:hypothetical protein
MSIYAVLCNSKKKNLLQVIFLFHWNNLQHVRSAYQPPASSTFLSEQTSHQQSASITFLSEQISNSHQPPAK